MGSQPERRRPNGTSLTTYGSAHTRELSRSATNLGLTRSGKLYLNRLLYTRGGATAVAPCGMFLSQAAAFSFHGSITILVTRSFLSRHTLYISGTSSKVMR